MAGDRAPFDEPQRGGKPCPICGKPASEATAPFCSKRCADVDLHKWLSGSYAVPADEPGQGGLPEEGEER